MYYNLPISFYLAYRSQVNPLNLRGPPLGHLLRYYIDLYKYLA